MSGVRSAGRGARFRALPAGAPCVRVRYLRDIGHGWSLVPRRLLDRLDVSAARSRDSDLGRTGRVVVVEEDLDRMAFARALERAGAALVVRGVLTAPAPSIVCRRRRFTNTPDEWRGRGER